MLESDLRRRAEEEETPSPSEKAGGSIVPHLAVPRIKKKGKEKKKKERVNETTEGKGGKRRNIWTLRFLLLCRRRWTNRCERFLASLSLLLPLLLSLSLSSYLRCTSHLSERRKLLLSMLRLRDVLLHCSLRSIASFRWGRADSKQPFRYPSSPLFIISRPDEIRSVD